MTTAFEAAAESQRHDAFELPGDALKTPAAALSDQGPAGAGDDDITAGQKMFSALSGSILTSLLVTPLDVVRVRWQSQPVRKGATIDFSKFTMNTNFNSMPTTNLGVTACCREVFFMNNNSEVCIAMPPRAASAAAASASATTAAECAVEETERKTFSSTLDGLRKIARNDGFTGLWRGLSPTLVMAVPSNIIYLTGYDWLRFNAKSPIAHRFGDDSAPLVAGSTARVMAAAAVSPIELFRTRMQASSGVSTTGHMVNTFKGIQDMVGVHGYTSLWRGLTLTMWRDVPFSGLYWWGYETIRGRLTDMREASRGRGRTETKPEAGELGEGSLRTKTRRRSQSRENHVDTFLDSFVSGATSGAMASIVTMPFDVGKTRTQVYRDGKQAVAVAGKGAAIPEQGSMVQLMLDIFKTEGVQGLWKGWIPRTLKVAPACAIMISSYEVGKRLFRSVNEKSKEGEGEQA